VKKSKLVFFVVALVVAGYHLVPMSNLSAIPSILADSLYVSPDSTEVSEGTIFTLEIWAPTDITELMGWDITVTFDPAVIEIQSVDEGWLPTTSSDTTFFWWFDQGAGTGTVHVNGAILGTTVDGPGALFSITFEALSVDAETDVDIVFSELRNGVNESIAHHTRSGYVKVDKSVSVRSATWGAIKKRYE